MDPETLAWTTFVLALIGAGAWIPTIREWMQKPEVYVVSSETIEVSYLEFGGVLNVSCAFAAFHKPPSSSPCLSTLNMREAVGANSSASG